MTAQTHDEPIKVLLVDEHEHVLWGLSKLIDGEWPRMMVIGVSKDMAHARVLVEARAPDVVVLDMDVGGNSAVETLLAAFSSGRSEVVVHTSVRDGALRERAMLAGARSVIDKEAPAAMLLREIERVYRERRPPNAAP